MNDLVVVIVVVVEIMISLPSQLITHRVRMVNILAVVVVAVEVTIYTYPLSLLKIQKKNPYIEDNDNE